MAIRQPRKEGYKDQWGNVAIKDGWIPLAHVQPLFDRLIAIYGTKAEVAKAMGIKKQGFLAPRKIYIQQKTYTKARELLASHETGLYKQNVSLEVVDRTQLALILRQWVIEFLANRPPAYDRYVSGPTQVIAERSGKSMRVVSGYINETHHTGVPWVGADIADALLIAIDETNAFYDGRLPVFPNPSLRMESWLTRMEARGCI